MLVLVLWTLLSVISAALVLLAVTVAEASWPGGPLASARSRLLAAAGAVVVLVLLAGAYQVHALAGPDGRLIAHVAAKPGSAIANAMTYLTLLGDSVPSLLIASIMAVIVYRQGVHTWACAILPILVLAELYVQLGMWKVFSDATIGILHPAIPIGGVGQIPSGSVARLLSIFLVSSLLWRAHDTRGARRVATLGAALTLAQISSRMVLGRHLYADIVAGLALGLLLTLLATFVIPNARARDELNQPGTSGDFLV